MGLDMPHDGPPPGSLHHAADAASAQRVRLVVTIALPPEDWRALGRLVGTRARSAWAREQVRARLAAGPAAPGGDSPSPAPDTRARRQVSVSLDAQDWLALGAIVGSRRRLAWLRALIRATVGPAT